ncbi:Protein of unknown function DUF423 [Kalmanozyma brasiliensis GHG001]|uniref:Protein of unknown function DUF423 n=1 Tax=Kalmanozyma brasiliensis (strain GHG001) TaxID=1365824 RepID=UPI001CE94B57|nr:Protein of unknown function DUF423 [Kalmanozyma brasiliensis GHG001]EST08296.2 Protein of unknown function DUF423 [Kalmanozyma brasiliensis GHG001]
MTYNMLHAFAGISGAVGVGFGAIGAHALKNKLNTYQMGAWTTATQYQLLHSLALLYTLSMPQTGPVVAAGYAFASGITMFSGSIYGLCLTKPDNPMRKVLGPITPIGGLSMIAGWLLLAYAKRPRSLR